MNYQDYIEITPGKRSGKGYTSLIRANIIMRLSRWMLTFMNTAYYGEAHH